MGFTWSLHNEEDHYRLEIIWKSKPMPNDVIVVKQTCRKTNPQDGKSFDKKKSPSRLARDRNRMKAFREKKRVEKVAFKNQQQHNKQESNLIIAHGRVANSSTRRYMIDHNHPIPIPIQNSTTILDMKTFLYTRLHDSYLIKNPESFTLLQTVGDQEHPDPLAPLLVLPNHLTLHQVYANSIIPKSIVYDILFDDEPGLEASSDTDTDKDWETDSTDSSSDE